MADFEEPFLLLFSDTDNFIHFHDALPNFDISLIQTGYHIPDSRMLMPPAIKDHYVLHFAQSGEGYFLLPDKTYKIVPNTCFLIYPDQPNVYYTEPNVKWEYFWIGIAGRDVDRILSMIGFSREHQALFFPKRQIFSILSNIYSSAIHYKEDPIGQALHTTPLVCTLLFELVDNARTKEPKFLEHISQDNSQLMNQGYFGNKYVKLVNKYIEDHFKEQITVEEIAKELHLNRCYLSTLYKANSNKSIKQYIHHYRILRATILLQRTDMSIADIAEQVGFKDPLYFSRVFKNHVKRTPTEYRSEFK